MELWRLTGQEITIFVVSTPMLDHDTRQPCNWNATPKSRDLLKCGYRRWANVAQQADEMLNENNRAFQSQSRNVRLHDLVTASLPITEWSRAFDLCRDRQALKVVLHP